MSGSKPGEAAASRSTRVRAYVGGPTIDLGFVLVTLTLFVSSWNGLSIPVFSHPVQLFLACALLVASVRTLRGSTGASRLPKWYFAAALIFLAAAILNVMFPVDPITFAQEQYEQIFSFSTPGSSAASGGSNFGNLFRLEFALVGLPFVIFALVRSERQLTTLATVWTVGVAISAGVAVLDAIAHTGISAALTGSAASTAATHRQQGLTAQPNHLGISCVIAIPFATAWLAQGRPTKSAVALTVLALLSGGIATSGSRGAAVSGALALLATFIVVSDLRRFAGVLAFALAMVAIVLLAEPAVQKSLGLATRLASGAGGTASSDAGRATLRNAGLSAFQARPAIGSGFQNLTAAHSIYLQMLASGGVLAAAAFATFFGGTLLTGMRAIRATGSVLACAGVVSVVAWLVAGGVENELSDVYLYVPSALVVAEAVLFSNVRSEALQRGIGLAAPGRWSRRRESLQSDVIV